MHFGLTNEHIVKIAELEEEYSLYRLKTGLQIALDELKQFSSQRYKKGNVLSLIRELDDVNSYLKNLQRDYSSRLGALNRKILICIPENVPRKEVGWIFKMINSFNSFDLNVENLEKSLNEILDFLWDRYYVQTQEVADEFDK